MINRVVSTVGSFFWSFAGRGGGPRPDRVASSTPPPQGRPERPRRLRGQGWDAQDASRGVQRSGCEGCWGGLVGGGAAAHTPGPPGRTAGRGPSGGSAPQASAGSARATRRGSSTP